MLQNMPKNAISTLKNSKFFKKLATNWDSREGRGRALPAPNLLDATNCQPHAQASLDTPVDELSAASQLCRVTINAELTPDQAHISGNPAVCRHLRISMRHINCLRDNSRTCWNAQMYTSIVATDPASLEIEKSCDFPRDSWKFLTEEIHHHHHHYELISVV